jgi:hypothetical protein
MWMDLPASTKKELKIALCRMCRVLKLKRLSGGT